MNCSKETIWHFNCSHCGKEHAMYGDGDPPLEDAFDKDEDIGYTGII